ncbi:MAG: hypothetical protein ABJI43_09550 [Roseobacter sp.]
MPDNEQSKAISIRVKHAHRSRYKNQRRHDLRIGHQPSYVDGGRAELNRVVVELPLPAQITKRAKELRERTNPSRAMRADAAIATIGIITFGHAAQPIFEALKRERTRCNACKTSWSCVFSDTDFKFGRSAASAIASASF